MSNQLCMFDDIEKQDHDEETKEYSSQITHFAIFEYWKDKYITESGDVSSSYIPDAIGVVEDWGEPCCFACGYHSSKMVFAHDNEKVGEDFKYLWSQPKIKELEKAHIVPRALGGKAVPENMFILCPKCHASSPDTVYRKEFFKWVYKKRTRYFEREKIKQIFRSCFEQGIPFVSPDIDYDSTDFSRFFTLINSHGSKLSEDSLPAVFVARSEEVFNSVIELICKKYGKLTADCFEDQVKRAIKSSKETLLADL